MSWPGATRFSVPVPVPVPVLAVLGACLAWGIDNNLTREVSLTDATWIAAVEGLGAGAVNPGLGLAMGASMPKWTGVGAALLVGLLAYGVSLPLFVVALRHLGTARTGAYFSVAPFFGALLALGEPATPALLAASGLMGWGVWLHLTEHHEHWHTHEALEHAHEHTLDAHHRHAEPDTSPGLHHSHAHRHEAFTHKHAHFPDAHHRHDH